MSNFSFSSSSGEYRDPTLGEINSFTLTHRSLLIFERPIESGNSDVVKISNNTIRIIDHFYSSGEEIEYQYLTEDGHIPIGIETTVVDGISTSYLPKKLYVIKISSIDIQVAATAEDALSLPPKPLVMNSLGTGQHKFLSKNQNKKCLISLDNVIQAPIIFAGIGGSITNNIGTFDTIFEINDISKFKSGDIIKIDNEYMRIFTVGVGNTAGNSNDYRIKVERSILGTNLEPHSIGSTITKIQGNYNIVDNVIYFTDAPYGNNLLGTGENVSGSDLEFTNLNSKSRFSGRVFLRSGVPLTAEEAYKNNYLFDSLSEYFDGYNKSFSLTVDGENISGFSTDNAIILINDVMQIPSRETGNSILNNFSLDENVGITSITFVGTSASVSYDVNTSQLPRGGIIFSVGSTEGLGYQPIVSAAGTAVVSISGTIQSVSIGNSGSGYRSGIQTSVRVGVRSENRSIEYIGDALISNGNVVGVSITNPGSGYTTTNPPRVFFDTPLSYWNVPLKYSSSSPAGIGTQATVDIIVGQQTNVISFDVRNLGYGYKPGEILTVDIGGQTGIPTDTSVTFKEFKIYVDEVRNDEFNGWSLGQLQLFDDINQLFDGERKTFPISVNGERISIRSRTGSDIDITANLIITINNVLQVPKLSYNIRGGSLITFSEPPRKEDKCKILFYKGTIDVDTIDRDILETIKEGDNVRIYSVNENLDQEFRSVEEILTSDTIRTNIYGGKGISVDADLRRPLIWCRQTEDKFINGKEVTKDRIIYEPLIFPETYLTQPVSISSSEFFVENIKTFFDSSNEYQISEDSQDKILLLSQEEFRPATATPVVSDNGSISNIQIDDSGYGYSSNPTIIISPPNDEEGEQCIASTNINVNGQITTISISNSGLGYTSTNPPLAIIEEPLFASEIVDDVLYEGDFGSIVGIGTTIIGGSSFGLIFDFFIPLNSFIRNQSNNRVGIASTGISNIKTNYYFKISNSNIGNNVESLRLDDSSIGIGTAFMDNVYQVYDYEIKSKYISGIGNTYVNSVRVKVENFGGIVGTSITSYYGDYSWGRIYAPRRKFAKEFTSYPVGITSSTIVRRYNPLKYLNYFA